jgi:hypothetical protein
MPKKLLKRGVRRAVRVTVSPPSTIELAKQSVPTIETPQTVERDLEVKRSFEL